MSRAELSAQSVWYHYVDKYLAPPLTNQEPPNINHGLSYHMGQGAVRSKMKPPPSLASDSQSRMTPAKIYAIKYDQRAHWGRRSLELPGRNVDCVRANYPPERSSTIKAKTAKEDQLPRNLPKFEVGHRSMGSGEKMKALTRIGVHSPLTIPVKAKCSRSTSSRFNFDKSIEEPNPSLLKKDLSSPNQPSEVKARTDETGKAKASQSLLLQPAQSFRRQKPRYTPVTEVLFKFAKPTEEPIPSLLKKDLSSPNQPSGAKVRTDETGKAKASQSLLQRAQSLRRQKSRYTPLTEGLSKPTTGVPDSLYCADEISIGTVNTLDTMLSASLEGVDFSDGSSVAVSVLDTASITSALNILAGAHGEGNSENPSSDDSTLHRHFERQGGLDHLDSNDVISLVSKVLSTLSRQNEKKVNVHPPIAEVDFGDDLSVATSVLDTVSIASALNTLAGVHEEGHSENPSSDGSTLHRRSENQGSLDHLDSNDVISLVSTVLSALSRQSGKKLNVHPPIAETYTTGKSNSNRRVENGINEIVHSSIEEKSSSIEDLIGNCGSGDRMGNVTCMMASSSNPNPKIPNKDTIGKSEFGEGVENGSTKIVQICENGRGDRMENGITLERDCVARKERTFRGRPISRVRSRFGSPTVACGDNLQRSTILSLRSAGSSSLPRRSSLRRVAKNPLPSSPKSEVTCDARNVPSPLKRDERSENPLPKEFRRRPTSRVKSRFGSSTVASGGGLSSRSSSRGSVTSPLPLLPKSEVKCDARNVSNSPKRDERPKNPLPKEFCGRPTSRVKSRFGSSTVESGKDHLPASSKVSLQSTRSISMPRGRSARSRSLPRRLPSRRLVTSPLPLMPKSEAKRYARNASNPLKRDERSENPLPKEFRGRPTSRVKSRFGSYTVESGEENIPGSSKVSLRSTTSSSARRGRSARSRSLPRRSSSRGLSPLQFSPKSEVQCDVRYVSNPPKRDERPENPLPKEFRGRPTSRVKTRFGSSTVGSGEDNLRASTKVSRRPTRSSNVPRERSARSRSSPRRSSSRGLSPLQFLPKPEVNCDARKASTPWKRDEKPKNPLPKEFRGRPTSRVKSRFGSSTVGSGEDNLAASTNQSLRSTRSSGTPRRSSPRGSVTSPRPSLPKSEVKCDTRKVSKLLKRYERPKNPSPRKGFKPSDRANDLHPAANRAGRQKERSSHSPPPPPQSLIPPPTAPKPSSVPAFTKGSAADKSTSVVSTNEPKLNTWQTPLFRKRMERRRAAMSQQ